MGARPSTPRGAHAPPPPPMPRSPSDETPSSSGDAGAAPPATPAAGRAPSLARMCAAVEALIVGVGEDVSREGLFDTPKVRGRGREREREQQRAGVRTGVREPAPRATPSTESERPPRTPAPPIHALPPSPPPHPSPPPLLQRVAKAWIDATVGLRQDAKR